MQKIIPHLWFDKEAKEAAEFYVSIFPDGKMLESYTIYDTPSGDAEAVSFELAGFRFAALSAGPFFKINPSISFMLNFNSSKDPNAAENLDLLWGRLAEGGKALMELGEYPFSKRYGWIEDKYGVSWQLILTNPEGDERPFIIPSLLFTEGVVGKAEEAMEYYVSIFKDAKVGMVARYPEGSEPNKAGTVMFEDFMLEGQWFAAMDSGLEHGFTFNEGISLMVNSETQEEIDYYWQLSAVPESEQCGWLKDKYGVVWQVTPRELDEMFVNGTREQQKRVTEAFMPMKKLDLAKLREAYEG